MGRRKVFDTESVRQFRVSLGWVLSDNFRVGQLPASRFNLWRLLYIASLCGCTNPLFWKMCSCTVVAYLEYRENP